MAKKFTVFFVHGKKQTDLTILESAGYKIEPYTTCMEFYYDQKNHANSPGILVIDVTTIGVTFDAFLQQLDTEDFTRPVILISSKMHYPTVVKTIREYWEAGSEIGFVCKPIGDKLLKAIEQVSDNRKVVEVDFDSLERNFGRLTTRELEILEKVMVGDPSHVIGESLDISIKTVEAHRARIHAKMHVDDVYDLLRMYLDYTSLVDA